MKTNTFGDKREYDLNRARIFPRGGKDSPKVDARIRLKRCIDKSKNQRENKSIWRSFNYKLQGARISPNWGPNLVSRRDYDAREKVQIQ